MTEKGRESGEDLMKQVAVVYALIQLGCYNRSTEQQQQQLASLQVVLTMAPVAAVFASYAAFAGKMHPAPSTLSCSGRVHEVEQECKG